MIFFWPDTKVVLRSVSYSGDAALLFSSCVYTSYIPALQILHHFRAGSPAGCTETKIRPAYITAPAEKREKNSPVITTYAPVSSFLTLLQKADSWVWEFYVPDIPYATIINQSHSECLRPASHLSSQKETSPRRLTKFLFCKFFFGRSPGLVQRCWLSCTRGVLCRIFITLYACHSRCWGELIWFTSSGRFWRCYFLSSFVHAGGVVQGNGGVNALFTCSHAADWWL